MSTPLAIGDARDLIDLSIGKIWLKGSETESSVYKQYCNVETGVTDYIVKDSSLSGLGYAGRIVENASVTAASPVQGYDQSYTQVNFGVLINFTKPMWFFGIKKRKLESITAEARKACSDLRELRCAERLDNAYSTTYVANDISGNYMVSIAGGNGVALASASQTREDGGTNNNNIITDGVTVNMDFEYDALKALQRTAALVKGPKGKKMNINPDTIIVSKGYPVAQRAAEILGALNKGVMPGSAERDGSGVPTYKILQLPWIESHTDYWFAFDSSMKTDMYGLQYKESQGTSLDGPNVVFKTDEIQYKATMQFDIGFNDYRGFFASKNTNAA